jgi:prephenate dehydrogenase
LLAFGLVDCLNNLEDVDEIFRFAAGGFRDFTRIASSDPVMWRDICLSNREQVLAMMKRYRDEMEKMYKILEAGDGEQLREIFERAKKARDAFCG